MLLAFEVNRHIFPHLHAAPCSLVLRFYGLQFAVPIVPGENRSREGPARPPFVTLESSDRFKTYGDPKL